jgi:xanthine dehydrogenase accessory factor
MSDPFQSAESFLATQAKCVLVKVATAKGSTPREPGAFMLVAADGTYGTVGGGQMEYAAIDRARQMLISGEPVSVLDMALGPEIGQCCGGRVKLALELAGDACRNELVLLEAAERAAYPHVYIFGAGHVGNALARVFALLPVTVKLIDSRQSELDAAPEGVEKHLAAMPEELVRTAPPGSAFLVLTHDHALDFLILREALARADASYVGMIGSKSKRATFQHWYLREGGSTDALLRLISPIGGSSVKDKRPAVIAALAAAEILAALSPAGDTHAAAPSSAYVGEN